MNKYYWFVIYVSIVLVLCWIFTDYQLIIAVLGLMGFCGYLRTRRLSNIKKEGDENNDHKGKA